MKDFFKELFEYSYSFNEKLGNIYHEMPDNIPEKAIQLYNHILNAHQVWNNRIESWQTPYGVWEIHPPALYLPINKTNYEQSLTLLEKHDLMSVINYSNTSGKVFSNTVRDILFHIINHSTYHRAQIATLFRQSGLTPLTSDFIFFKR